MQINTNKVGLVVGALMGGWHLLWSILVISGIGQVLIDFVLWMHMIEVPYFVGPFDLTASLTLIIVTSIIGYCMGCVMAMIWNRVHK